MSLSTYHSFIQQIFIGLYVVASLGKVVFSKQIISMFFIHLVNSLTHSLTINAF